MLALVTVRNKIGKFCKRSLALVRSTHSLAPSSRSRPALPCCTSLTLTLRKVKELVPHVKRLELFLKLREHGWPCQDPLSPKVQSTLE